MDEANDLSYQASNSSDIVKESLTPYTDAVKCRKSVNHVKRPLNPFMIWSQMERRKILEQNPNIHCQDVSIQLGKRWKALSDKERIPFAVEAERLRVLHSQEFPNYKFSPKRRKRRNQEMNVNSLNMKKVCPQNKSSVPVLGNAGKEDGKFITRDNLNCLKIRKAEKCETAVSDSITAVSSEGKEKLNCSQEDKLSEQAAGMSKEVTSKIMRKRREKYPNITTEGKHIWDSLKDITITSLAIDKTDLADIYKSDDSSQQLKQSSLKKPLPPRLHIDNCLTSGSIAALSCYKDDWAAVFDYLTDKVLQSSKNIYEEIDSINKQNGEALKGENNVYPNEPLELNIPDINKVLGKNWKDPNFGLRFSS